MNYAVRAALLATAGSSLLTAQAWPRFTDVTGQVGVNFTHTDLIDTMAGGLCILDYDNDGFNDVYVTSRATAPNRLFKSLRNGTFVDVTTAAGVGIQAGSMGAFAADLDNDGWQEILVVGTGRSYLLRNNQDGTFTDIAAAAGIVNFGWATAATFGDYDRDGLLDIYIGNYIDDGFFPYFDGGANKLFHNEGGLKFRDVSVQAGVEGWATFLDPRGFVRSTYACTLSTLFYDVDRDGWLDLLVGNDFGPFIIPDLLYLNNKDGTFTEMGAALNFRIAEFNMGLAAADVNGDLVPDVYTTNLGNNHLLLNDGRGRFTDVAGPWGAQEGTSNGKLLTSWACMFLDADLDGLRDLYVANGFIQTVPAMDNDPLAPSRLLYNLGRSYMIVPTQLVPWDTGVGRGAACGDIDGDGDEDVVLLNNRDVLRFYRNDTFTTNRSLMLDFVGTRSNRDAIGSYVKARSPQMTQAFDVLRGGSYASCNAAPLTIGLGSDTRLDEIQVTWPTGVQSRMLALAAGQRHQVIEPTVTVLSIGSARPIGNDYIEIPVQLRNWAPTPEAVTFTAGLSLGTLRASIPVYAWPATLGGGAQTTQNVYLPISYAALPLAQQLGIWVEIDAHSRGGQDQVEVPLR